MDRKDLAIAIYRDFETPDGDDRAFYEALTPAERIGITIDLLPSSIVNGGRIELLESRASTGLTS